MPIQLDVISDTICPWCYIGKRHLESALPVLAAEGLGLQLRWRPFQLNPDMPGQGVERARYRAAKFGSAERGAALDAQVASAGAATGLRFRHDLMARTPNTVLSHILVAAADHDPALQDRVVEALFAAYFTQGIDVGDPDALAAIGQSCGLRDAPALLADPARADAVHEEERLARQLWIDGVPSVALAGQVLFSGAQPPEMMVASLRRAAAMAA